MNAVEKVLQDFLVAFEKVKGAAARRDLDLRWTGGTQVVMRNSVASHARLIDLGTLRLMTDHLGRVA